MPDRMPMLQFVSGCRLLAALVADSEYDVKDSELELLCQPGTLEATLRFLEDGGFLNTSGQRPSVASGVLRTTRSSKAVERLSDFAEDSLQAMINLAVTKARMPFTLRVGQVSEADASAILTLLQGTPHMDFAKKLETLSFLQTMDSLGVEALRSACVKGWRHLAGQCLMNPALGLEIIEKVCKDWHLLEEHLEISAALSLYPAPEKPHFIERIPLAPSPSRIVELLKDVVIGQEDAKRKVATLIHYQMVLRAKEQWRNGPDLRQLLPLLLVGPTGCGKTLLVSKVCALASLPFLHVDCAGMVSEGIVGYSVGDIGRQLLQAHGNEVERVRYAVVFLDEFDKLLSTQYGDDVLAQTLRILEGGPIHMATHHKDTAKSQDPVLPTKDMLFIIGGTFQRLYEQSPRKIGFSSKEGTNTRGVTVEDLRTAGVPSELLGRVGNFSIMRELTAADLEKVLRSRSSPLKAVNDMMGIHDSRMNLPKSVEKQIAQAAHRMRLGARGLRQIIHALVAPYLFSVPDKPGQQITPTQEEVNRVLQDLEAAYGTAAQT